MRVIPSSLAAFETLRLVRASAFFIKCKTSESFSNDLVGIQPQFKQLIQLLI